MGQLRYFSCVNQVDAVVGNSSSGLLEVPSFGKATINIGDRQLGRLRASSVIDCEPFSDDIVEAVRKIYSKNFQTELQLAVNPYGTGGAVNAIVQKLLNIPYEDLLKKSFHDIVF